MLKNFLNNYFGFNKQQRNGLFILLLISFLLLLVRLVYPSFIRPDAIVLLNLPLIEKKLDSSYATSKPFSKNKFQSDSKQATLFVFDPNTVSAEQLQQLGLKEKTVQIFLKFRKKGFVFKEKVDLKKVYGISDRLYAQLEPYILIGEERNERQEAGNKTQETRGEKQDARDKNQEIRDKSQDARDKTQETGGKIQDARGKTQVTVRVELNSCDSAALVALNGIGASYAKRILKYRTMLGGYISVEQLKEVYGFSEELYSKSESPIFMWKLKTSKK